MLIGPTYIPSGAGLVVRQRVAEAVTRTHVLAFRPVRAGKLPRQPIESWRRDCGVDATEEERALTRDERRPLARGGADVVQIRPERPIPRPRVGAARPTEEDCSCGRRLEAHR